MYINLARREEQRRTILGILDGDIPFGFHFQPIADLERGVVAGYEALSRFPEEVSARPGQVFQSASEIGRRADLESLVVRAALTERHKLPPNCFLTVNAGPSLLMSRQWQYLLKDIGHLGGTVIEITEDEPIHDYAIFRRRLEQIREAGGHIAVDDTGAGYASLKHVMELRPNFIKLDRFFVGGCNKEAARSSLIEMMGTMASRMDAWIIAEGVETAAELDELLHLGVPLAQGYYLGKPDPVMHPLPLQHGDMIRTRTQALAQCNLASATEACFSCVDEVAAENYLAQNAETRLVVVVDEHSRPVKLLERHPLAGMRMVLRPLRAVKKSDIRDVLGRCLARVTEERYDPVAVVSDEGVFEGIAMMERMVKAVLESESLPGIRSAELRTLLGHPDTAARFLRN
ncbi:EAL domain-containing protein [Terriglobus tenax]|uniref:EAL domain-containing protein n=1 Tax=Terriglobus tenax TaxID=1111115 RepID=UPI0021E0D701|nr:EAL domain-containing protein [Terriglobus tenax]